MHRLRPQQLAARRSRRPRGVVKTMHLRYDEDFVEGAIFLCASGKRQDVPHLQVLRFHREREILYSLLDPDERNAAFFRLHLEWFREWGLEKWLLRTLEEFPLLSGALQVLAFRKARGKSDEGAELYVNPETGRSGVVALRVERFALEQDLTPFLRHELTHLQDMVDPAFGYARELDVAGHTASPQRLTRERYRVLWDVTIDGRLLNGGRAGIATRDQRWAEFDRAYSFWPESRRQTVFDLLWNGPAPSHQQLLVHACDPRGLHSAQQPLPGAPCPLCSFPTFDWADCRAIKPESLAAIQAQYPVWTAAQGACQRCVEVFDAALQFHAT